MKRNPELVVACGPMFSGKTTFVLSYAEKCKFQKKKVAAFKPAMDNRYATSDIVSHGGWKLPAVCVESGNDIIKYLAASPEVYDVIIVDELFMITDVADLLLWAFRSGLTVVVSTLDLSAKCTGFPEVKKLLPYATKIIKCTAVCSVCGNDARYTYRKAGADVVSEIFVGGADVYEPRCFHHHPDMGEVVDSPSENMV